LGPFAIGLEQSVCQEDQLSHDSGEGDLGRLSGIGELGVFCFQVRLKRAAISAGMESAWRMPARPPADEGATVPAARLSRHRRKACETYGLSGFEGAELEHFDQQGEGGYGRDARNTGQDREPLGEVGIGLTCSRIAASIAVIWRLLCSIRYALWFQQWRGKALPRFLTAVRSFAEASRAR
jgi:hypothetical protein